MKEYIVTHKYCGMTKHIKGWDIWDALRSNGLDPKYWS